MLSVVGRLPYHLLRPLCSPSSLSFMQAVAVDFPPSSYAIVEVPLDKNLADSDISINIQSSVFQYIDSIDLQSNLASLKPLVEAWGKDDSLLSKHLNDLWLELDYAHAGKQYIPFGTVKNLPLGQDTKIIDFITGGLGRQLSADGKKLLIRLIASLPDTAVISHLAVMAGRDGEPLRINVKKLHATQLYDLFRENTAWAFALDYTELIDSLIACADSFTLGFDMSDALSDRVGIEFFFTDQMNGRTKQFMDALVVAGLMDAAQIPDISAWVGIEPIAADGDGEGVELLSAFMQPIAQSHMWRIINHFKLVLSPTGPPLAKAYLSAGYSCDQTEP